MQVTLDTKSITDPATKIANHLKYSAKSLKDGAIDAGNKIKDACAPAIDAVKTYGLGIGTKAEIHYCGKCGINIEEFGHINFCPQCGKKI